MLLVLRLFAVYAATAALCLLADTSGETSATFGLSLLLLALPRRRAIS